MKVNDVSQSNELSSNKVKKSSGGESFASYLQRAQQSEASPISAMTNISSLDAIFATQMADAVEEKEKRKKMIKRGHNLLEKLEEIRDALLVGQIDKERLIEIARLLKNDHSSCDDPKLSEIIAEIELRVEVELAKLTN